MGVFASPEDFRVDEIPLYRPAGAVAERESAVLESRGVALENLRPPRGIRLRGARRALRVRPGRARVEPRVGALRLDFTLPPGSYASVLVEELLARRSG